MGMENKMVILCVALRSPVGKVFIHLASRLYRATFPLGGFMQTQKYLVAFTIAVCVFSALGMLFSVSLESRGLVDLAIVAALFLLPCAAALLLSGHVRQPFLGEMPSGSYWE
jgi:hypothetical protein